MDKENVVNTHNGILSGHKKGTQWNIIQRLKKEQKSSHVWEHGGA